LRTMTPMWIGRIAILLLALTAASAAAFVSGFPRERHPPVKTGDAIAAAAVAATTVGGKDEGSDSRVMAPAIGVPHHSLSSGDAVIPTLDVALVGPTGDAVIAGTAAPGATVELLRNSEPLARAVANQFGQFAMDPPRLPPGHYELTLRSTQPNGKQAASRKSVAVKVR